MVNNRDQEIRSLIDEEIQKDISDMDTEKIDRLLNDVCKDIPVPPKGKKQIYRNVVKAAQPEPTAIPKRRLILITTVTLLLTIGIVTAYANSETVIKGLRWVGEKLNICTTEITTEEGNEALRQKVNEFINNEKYILPSALNDMAIKSISENDREDEGLDVCLEFVKEDYYLNVIISSYASFYLENFEAPSDNVEPVDQFVVSGITVTLFQVEDVFTAYYTYQNHTYQITSDIDKSSFYNILKEIK